MLLQLIYCAHTHAHMYTCLHTHKHTHAYVHTRALAHTHTHILTHMHARTHTTHTHTYCTRTHVRTCTTVMHYLTFIFSVLVCSWIYEYRIFIVYRGKDGTLHIFSINFVTFRFNGEDHLFNFIPDLISILTQTSSNTEWVLHIFVCMRVCLHACVRVS